MASPIGFTAAARTAETTLRHGYSPADLNRLARTAMICCRVKRGVSSQILDFDDGMEVAWSAIAELIYTAETPPPEYEMVNQGMRSITSHVKKEMSYQGISFGRGYHEMAAYHAYWVFHARHTQSPEDQVVDRLALRQIWCTLTPRNKEVLAALARYEDYAAAADSVGLRYNRFTTELWRARRKFRELWHEGEIPSRSWGHDKRVTPGSSHHPTVMYRAMRRSRRQQLKRGSRPVP